MAKRKRRGKRKHAKRPARKKKSRSPEGPIPGEAPGGEPIGMRPFGTADEAIAACLAVRRWLSAFVKRFEDGVREAGFTVEKRVIARDPDGAADPVLALCGPGGWTMELHLRNALEEFLMIDRDERPARFDARLLDDEFAEEKIADLADGRLAMLRAIRDGKTPERIKDNLQKLAGGFERITIVEQEQ